MASITVQVLIIFASGFAAAPVRVEVTVRGREGALVVGSATPDESGRCVVTYDPEAAVDRAAKKRPRVRLRVMAGDAPLSLHGGPTVWPYDAAPQAVEVWVGDVEAPAPVTVRGTISAEADGAPLRGLTVTVTLTADSRGQTLASLVTDRRGAFRVAYDPATFPLWAQQGEAIVVLRVIRDGAPLPVVKGPRQWALGKEPDRADIVVDARGKRPGEEDGDGPRIRGTIRHTDGSPIAGVTVEAVRLSLTGEQILASATTGSDGAYRLPSDPAESPWLFVRVLGEDGRGVAASPPVNGAHSQWVDVYVGDERFRGPSDFQRVHKALAPLIEGRDLAALEARSVGFLVHRTGLHRKQVTPYLLARRQAEVSRVDAEALYGLIRGGGTRAVGRLLNASEATIVQRLRSAGEANVVSLAVANSGPAVYARLRESLAREAASSTAPGAFGSLLRTTSLKESQRSTFIARHLKHTGKPRDFWAALRADQDFGDAAVDDVQFSLHLGVLTGNHTPLVSALRSDARVGRARDLVAFTEADWLAHIRSTRESGAVGVPASVAGATQADREAAYARRLLEDVQRAWPTASVAARMRDDDFAGKDLLLPFLDANEDFDFGRSHAQTWFRSDDAVLPEGANVELLAVVARHQRLFRISPSVDRWSSMRALDAAGLASARDVVRTGKRAFIARFASRVGGAVRAREIYEAAAVQNARAVNLIANLGTAYQGPPVLTVPDVVAGMAGLEESSVLPEWRTLFGSIDFCACEHCRSILSPAAYLTDLLHWLKNELPEEEALKPLRDKRPDLFALELSCENTNTVMPYVDLVLEVMEDRVAGIASPDPVKHTASTLPSEVLLAHPEYLNRAVYDVLAKAAFPFTLPFDLTAQQGRVYLEQQGVQRADLMAAFQRGGQPSDVAVAAEHLGLTSAERDARDRTVRPPATGALGLSASGPGWPRWPARPNSSIAAGFRSPICSTSSTSAGSTRIGDTAWCRPRASRTAIWPR